MDKLLEFQPTLERTIISLPQTLEGFLKLKQPEESNIDEVGVSDGERSNIFLANWKQKRKVITLPAGDVKESRQKPILVLVCFLFANLTIIYFNSLQFLSFWGGLLSR